MRHPAAEGPLPAAPAMGASRPAAALRARAGGLAAAAIVAGLAGYVAANLVTPLYRAEIQVLAGARDLGAADAPADITPQIGLLRSRELARAVVRDLSLADRAEFTSGGDMLSLAARMMGIIREPRARELEDRAVLALVRGLEIVPADRSRLIGVAFSASDPDLAARIANTVGDTLLALERQAGIEAGRQAAQRLVADADAIRARVAAAEARLEEFRSRNDIVPGSGSLLRQDIAELTAQVAQLRAQRAQAEARARAIRQSLGRGAASELGDHGGSELIRRLGQERAALRASLAEQSTTLLPQHPRIRELRAQIADLEDQMRGEAERVARASDAETRTLDARIEALAGTLDQRRRQGASTSEQEAHLRSLEREANAERDALDVALDRIRDLETRGISGGSRIVSRALPPRAASTPDPVTTGFGAALVALLAGVGWFGVRALLVAGRSPPAPPVAAVGEPEELAVPVFARLTAGPAHEGSAAVGTLADAVIRAGPGLRRLVVTRWASAGRSSGFAVALARSLATEGERVVLVGLDPTGRLERLLEGTAPEGIADLVVGRASFGSVIHRDAASPVHVVPFGTGGHAATDVLASGRLGLALGALSRTYDRVILDAPVLGTGPEIAALRRVAAHVVLISGADPTDEDFIATYGQLLEADFHDVAVVLEAAPATARSLAMSPGLAARAA